MIVEKIYEYLSQENKSLNEALRYEVEKMAGAAFKRQFMETREIELAKKLRLSSAGKCARQLAYGFHGYDVKGKEIDARSKLIFWTGDLVEMTVSCLAKIAGCKLAFSGLHQLRISIAIGDNIVEGHPDGLLIDDGQVYLVEIKSMSSYSFEKFERGEIEESYLAQVNAYMDALQVDKCIFVALNKENGVLHEMILDRDPMIVTHLKANLLSVLNSTKEKLPLPPSQYYPDAKGNYPWQCLYCAYWGHCRPNAEKVLVGKSYKLREKKNGDRLSEETRGSSPDDRKKRYRVLKGSLNVVVPTRDEKDGFGK